MKQTAVTGCHERLDQHGLCNTLSAQADSSHRAWCDCLKVSSPQSAQHVQTHRHTTTYVHRLICTTHTHVRTYTYALMFETLSCTLTPSHSHILTPSPSHPPTFTLTLTASYPHTLTFSHTDILTSSHPHHLTLSHSD